jgi:O-antigen/teichoic acid export membrane protein
VTNQFIKNASWAMFDKFIVLFGSLIAYVLVSKHLGPESFGVLMFGVTISALGITISQWGSNHVIFNSAVKRPSISQSFIFNTEKTRLVIYIAYWLISSIVVFYYVDDAGSSIIISLMVASHVFAALDIFQFYLEGALKSKVNARTNMMARLVSTTTRIVFVWLACNEYWFVIPFLINNLLLYYFRRKNTIVNRKKLTRNVRKVFFQRGKYFFYAGLFAFVYTKINDFVLASLLGLDSVGLLNVAVTLGYSFTFIPIALGNTYINKCLKSSDINGNFVFVNFIMIISYFPLIVMFFFFGEYLVSFLLGNQYLAISDFLWLMATSGLLSSLGVINSRFMGNIEGGSRYLFLKVAVCSVISIPLSYYLIGKYGFGGAVFSMLTIELLSLTLLNYFFNNGLIAKLHLFLLRVNVKKVYWFIKG